MARTRTPSLALALVALVALAPLASAQQHAVVTIALDAPPEALTKDATVTTTGVVTYTADLTTHVSTLGHGIPVAYAIVAKPDWLDVVVSPANDVFPAPSTFTHAYTSERPVTLTFNVIPENATQDAVGSVELKAVTAAGIGGKSASATAKVPVRLVVPQEEAPCDEPAGAAHAAAGDGAAQDEEGDLTVQTSSASSRTPWVAVAGFALAGAGVGLVLRRRT